MSQNLSEAIKLYGTEEPVEPMRTLTAGPLTAEFDQGALRFIKIHGKEAIRNIAFVVRDKDWGTYQPALSNLVIDQETDSFSVRFDAVCKDDQQEIHYHAAISGSADGSLRCTGSYHAITDFVTNRNGFVVLHPVRGVSGNPVAVEQVDGTILQSEFPELVDPIQPFKDIRALTHEVLPGVSVCCRMTGDTFEMEDHRQWNDASYKTYVRPIALPWPYTIPAGEKHEQIITLSIEDAAGQAHVRATSQATEPCVINVETGGSPSLQMPRIGLGLEPQHLAGARAHPELLKNLGPQQLVTWHEFAKHGVDELRQAGELSREINADLVLHAVIPDKNYKAEVTQLATQCEQAGLSLAAISVAPAIYLMSIMPGTNWPDVTPLADLYDQVRREFPGVMLGGGMLSFFPELNRHRPPIAHLDYVTHASNTITHACDDITATENLEAIPYIIKTCRSFSGDKPYHVGPSSIGMHFNPYGSKVMDNPDNARIAMARMEPRQRGLLNAAWTVGYVAHFCRGGADTISLHAPTGEFGVINHPQPWQQPGFDNSSHRVYPAYHCVAGFAQASGMEMLDAQSSASREVEAVANLENGKPVVWIANLTSVKQSVVLKGLDSDKASIATLSLETFENCSKNPDGFEQTAVQATASTLDLGPYSVLRLRSD